MCDVRYRPEAVAELNELRAFDRVRLLDAIAKTLRDTPASPGGKKKRLDLGGGDFIWQLRVNNYRVFYDVVEAERLVIVRHVPAQGPQEHRGDSMKFVGVREAQAQLSGLVDQSQKERIVLTRHGQPIAVLTGVEGKDLEAVLLAQDPEFRKLIEQRRRFHGALVSHEALKAQAERELARERRVTRPRPRTTRGRTGKK